MSIAYSSHEGQALRFALTEHFGPCTCHSWHVISGARVWVETCAGHRFLSEPNRLALLLGMARDRARLNAEEHREKTEGFRGVLPW